MRVCSGLFDRMVLQRTQKNICDVVVEGICDSDGVLIASVRRKTRFVNGFQKVKIGMALRKGNFREG